MLRRAGDLAGEWGFKDFKVVKDLRDFREVKGFREWGIGEREKFF